MPPKKPGDKQNLEQELALLPDWDRLCCKFLAEIQSDRLQLITQKLKENKYDFIKIISKESLGAFAQEKGIYYDMNSMDKKPVKGQAEVANELTPQILAKALSMFVEETDLQGRRTKKEKLEEIEQQSPGKDNIKKGSPKKEPKKETKKAGKAVIQQIAQEEEQNEEIIIKQFQKNADIIYLFLDYPSLPEELEEILNQNIIHFNVIYLVSEKLIKQEKNVDIEKILKPIENFEEDIVKRMNDFIEKPGEQNIEQAEKILSQEKNDIEEQKQMEANLNLYSLFCSKQKDSAITSPLRDLFLKKQQIILNLLEQESIEIQFDELINDFIEFLCNISMDIEQFSKWKSTKKVVPIYQSQKKEMEEVKQIESRPASQQDKKSRPETKEKPAIDLKSVKKAGKESKKDEQKRLEEEQKKREQEELEEKKKQEEEEVKRKKEKEEEEKILQSQKFGAKNNLFFYNKQMNLITDEKISAAVYLECLVDQICVDEQKVLEESLPPHTKDLTEQQNQCKGKLQEIKQNLSKDKNKEQLNKLFDSVEARISAQFVNKNLDQLRKESDWVRQQEQRQIILKEDDKIGIRTFNCELHNLDKLEARERVVLSMCNYLPGINRQLMPLVPTKPELIRKAQFQKIIPFISTSFSQFQRAKTLNTFEKLLADKHHEREINFSDRIYQSHLDETCLPQVLFNALLFDPDRILHYNQEDDTLLMVLYFNNPPGRILRKYWEYQWKALPNLQNWVLNFKSNPENLNNNKFYDLDYEDFGDIHERIKYMYPNDKSVIICQQIQVGDQTQHIYKIIKDYIVMGIKEQIQTNIKNDKIEEHALYWINFQNNNKFCAEMEWITEKKKEKTKETNNQILSTPNNQSISGEQEEEKVEQQQQNEKEQQQQKQQEEEQKEEGKENENDDDYENKKLKVTFTLSFSNGLIIKFLPNGEIIQQLNSGQSLTIKRNFEEIINAEDQRENSKKQELSRIITMEGTVIKQMKDGSQEMLFRNGNFWSTKKRGLWQVNSNEGFKLQPHLSLISPESPLKDSSAFDFNETSVDVKLDPMTGNKVYRRIDQVITTITPNNITLVKHADGTMMKTFTHGKKEQHQIIENPIGFASVLLRHDRQKQRQWFKKSGVTTIGQGGMAASQGDVDIMERSVDGNLIILTAPNNAAVVTGHKERRELPGIDNYYDVFVWVVKMDDGSAIKVEEDGEVVFIAANERKNFNQQQEHPKPYGQDVAYHLQLFSPKDERKVGVYTVELNKNILWTFDNERNYFELHSNGQVKQRIAISFIQNDPFAELTPRFKTPEYIDEENLFLPAPDNWIPPRLFLINNDNTGYEILSQQQLDHEFHLKSLDKKINFQTKKLINYELLSYFQKLKDKMNKPIYNLVKELPQIVGEIPQTKSKNKKQKTRMYTQKNYQKYGEFGEQERKTFANDWQKYEQFSQAFQKQKASYSIMEKTSEKQNELHIEERIEKLMRVNTGDSNSEMQELEMSQELSQIQ